MGQLVSSLYTPRVREARMRFESGIAATLRDPEMDPARFELFLIQYCSRGVRMTEPVESWIFRAGQRCESIGLSALGRTLQQHARHEAGHHLMFIEDTRTLVKSWNERRTPALDADTLLAAAPSRGTDYYVELHERVIAGPTPYAQLGIEYEIEGLSVSWAPGLMEQAKRLLGAEVMAGMSFLVEHAEVDIGHTNLNESQMEKLLDQHPEFAEACARAGSEALDAYGQYLSDCLAAASELARPSGRRAEAVGSASAHS
jgi:hypothetical protein